MNYFNAILKWIFFITKTKSKHLSDNAAGHYSSIFFWVLYFCTWFTFKGFHWATGTCIWTHVILKDKYKFEQWESIRHDNVDKQYPIAGLGSHGLLSSLLAFRSKKLLRSLGLIRALPGSLTIFSKKRQQTKTKRNKKLSKCFSIGVMPNIQRFDDQRDTNHS